MKIFLLLTVMVLAVGNLSAQNTEVVEADGFDYSPSSLTINAGDSVRFAAGASHPTRQVSKETWDDNGTTLLQGGFDFPGGNGTVAFPDPGTYYFVCVTHVSSGMKGKITVQEATGVDEQVSAKALIYPVPLTGNELTVELGRSVQQAEIRIYDLSGRLKISKVQTSASSVLQVDCSSLQSGAYLLKLITSEGIQNTKFIRQ